MTDPLIIEARKYASWALEERLLPAKQKQERGAGKTLDTLKARIARVRCGEGDTYPEVRAAYLALQGR